MMETEKKGRDEGGEKLHHQFPSGKSVNAERLNYRQERKRKKKKKKGRNDPVSTIYIF